MHFSQDDTRCSDMWKRKMALFRAIGRKWEMRNWPFFPGTQIRRVSSQEEITLSLERAFFFQSFPLASGYEGLSKGSSCSGKPSPLLK
jgi:hypothetical protein